MTIKPGDVFQAVLKRVAPDGEATYGERVEGYRMIILSVDGEIVAYQRQGGVPSQTTLAILLDAIHRGDLVRVKEGPMC